MNETMYHRFEQDKRTARAREALDAGVMQVTPAPDGSTELAEVGWTVTNGNGSRGPYHVTRQPDWACTCGDFTNRCEARGLRCKHIEAVRLSLQSASAANTEVPPMENNTEQAGLVKFSLFLNGELPLYFTVAPATDVNALIEKAINAVDVARNAGLTLNLSGLEAGEKTETVYGYVRGERGDGQPCIFLYGHDRMEFRVTTIWEEYIPQMPFEVDTQLEVQSLPAPKRSVAVRKGWFKEVAPFTIVLEKTGKQTDEGKDIYRFARLHGAVPAADTLSGTPRGNGNGGNGSAALTTGGGQPPARSDNGQPMTVTEAREVVLHIGSDPNLRGQKLGRLVDGGPRTRQVITWLATEYSPGDEAGVRLKKAAAVLALEKAPF